MELPGVSKVLIAGQIKPHPDDQSSVLYANKPTSEVNVFKGGWTEEKFAYSAYINYMVHLEELGIDVVKIDSISYLGLALAGMYSRSMHAPRGDRIVKRRVVSVSPEANAVKALYPDLRLDAKACESIAKVAGVRLGMGWLNELREKNDGKLLIKDITEALPGVGRPTIRRLFNV